MHEVEVRRKAHRDSGFRATEANGFATAEVLDFTLGESERVRRLAERAEVFCKETFCRVAQATLIALQEFCRTNTDVALKHGEDCLLVVGLQNFLEEDVAFLHFLRLVGKLLTAADEAIEATRNEEHHNDCATEIHERSHYEASSKGSTSSDEPSTDYGEHTRDAEHGAFTRPGAVGKACTHGNHEGNEGRREGEFQRCTQGNEQGCHHKVDRGAEQVVSHRVVLTFCRHHKAAVNSAKHTVGDNLHHRLSRRISPSYEAASGF